MKKVIVPSLLGWGTIKVHNAYKTTDTVVHSQESWINLSSCPSFRNSEHGRLLGGLVKGRD